MGYVVGGRSSSRGWGRVGVGMGGVGGWGGVGEGVE